MKPTNPINTTNHCLQGQKLPANWRAMASRNAKQAEADYLDRLQNAWRGNNQQPTGRLIRDCRLGRNDSVDDGHNHHHRVIASQQIRADGKMVLVDERADGWQQWRDETTGATIWRRLSWSDIVGRR